MIKLKLIYKYYIISLVVLISLFTSGCINSDFDKFEKDSELNIGVTRNSTGYYPWMAVRDTTTLSVNINIFNSLIKIDKHDLGFQPALALDWHNPDNLTWRFFLRKDVKFHNGYNFSAEDVKFTIEYLKNFSYGAELLQQIVKVKVLDNYTIDLITEKPYPNLLNKLLTIYILSKQYMLESENFNETWPIGTGAYKLVEDIPGKHIILERFEEYWNELPDITKVVFNKMNDTVELIDGLKQGDLDIIPITLENVKEITNLDGFKISSGKPPNVVYISFDFRENGSYGFPDGENPTSDVRVRKAMYHALNITELISDHKFLNESAEPVSQFITEHLFGYNPDITRLPYDLEKAKKYMKEAGFENGFNITFDAPLSESAINISNDIVEQLSEINITLKTNFLPSTEYYINLYYKNTSLYITSINHFDAETSLNLLLHTSNMKENKGIWNYGNYSNVNVDRLIDELSYAMDSDLRLSLIQEAFSIASDDVAWIPLYTSKAFYAVREDLIWNPRPSLFIWVEEVYLE